MSEDIFHVIEKIKKIKGVHTDTAVAKALDMSKENLFHYKKSGTIPHDALLSFCSREKISIDSLLSQEDKAPPQPGSNADEIAELRKEIMRLQGYIIDMGGEIGRIKDRMLDASQTGDIHRLGIVGGKG